MLKTQGILLNNVDVRSRNVGTIDCGGLFFIGGEFFSFLYLRSLGKISQIAAPSCKTMRLDIGILLKNADFSIERYPGD